MFHHILNNTFLECKLSFSFATSRNYCLLRLRLTKRVQYLKSCNSSINKWLHGTSKEQRVTDSSIMIFVVIQKLMCITNFFRIFHTFGEMEVFVHHKSSCINSSNIRGGFATLDCFNMLLPNCSGHTD